MAYYTGVDTATKIIQKQEIWMRDTRYLNDMSETQFGFEVFKNAYQMPALQKQFNYLIKEIPTMNNVFWKTKDFFTDSTYNFKSPVYLACLS